mmetsp:Transcript_11884/g.38868  ORF Transcript_11884/g.38868 Transcript_11884/m.38868 type:complete len:310 (+) Transcript_11884:150-1079(+)
MLLLAAHLLVTPCRHHATPISMAEALEALPRRELQALAKQSGLRANQKSSVLIAQLSGRNGGVWPPAGVAGAPVDLPAAEDEDLRLLSRRELQEVAKRRGVRANAKSSEIISALESLRHADRAAPEPDPAPAPPEAAAPVEAADVGLDLGEMAETPGGNQTPGKASKKLKDSKFGETIFEEAGEWEAGEKEGRGVMRFADGDVYEGEWKAGLKNGQGVYRSANGDVFDGEWKADMMEGQGIFRFANGDVDANSYHQNEIVGEGIVWLADGRKAWQLQDGEPVEAISLEEARRTAERLGLPLPSPLPGAA